MELVLSRRLERGQGRRVLKSSGKLGMVAFGVLVLFFVGYLLWSLMFPPVKPEEELPTATRPQMRLTAPTMAPAPPSVNQPGPRRNGKQTVTLPEPDPDSAIDRIHAPAPRPQLPPVPELPR